jgi:hypothetical protein
MTSFLIFLAACAGIAAFGWIVSRITGAHAWLLENWAYEPNEAIVWKDDKADVMVIPRWGGAVIMTPARMHRWSAVATNRRVILANRSLTGKRMVMYVLYPGQAPDGQDKKLGGGLLTRGYQTITIQPNTAEPHTDEHFQPPYIALTPIPAAASSFNMLEIRLYTDDTAGFRLPTPA